MLNKKSDGSVVSYLGLGLMLLAFILAVVVTSVTGSDYSTENIIMTVALAAAALVTVSGYLTMAIIVAAVTTVAFAGLKIYSVMSMQKEFPPISFLWIILPAMCVVGISQRFSSLKKSSEDSVRESDKDMKS